MIDKIIQIAYLGFLLALSVSGLSQSNVQAMVLDSKTHKAIPYVNIGIPSLAIGTVSDLKGNFDWSGSDDQDSVMFSCIGYESKNLLYSQIKEQKTVYLNPIEYTLSNIEVKATRFGEEEIILGARNKKRGLSLGFGSTQLGTEVGSKISIKQPFFVKSAHFVLNHAKGDSMIYRMNVYALSEEGEVGEQLLKDQIIIRREQKKGTINVDLEKYNIILEGDILLCLEWLENDNGKGNMGLSFDLKKGKQDPGIYFKSTSHAGFFKSNKINKYKPCFYLKGKISTP